MSANPGRLLFGVQPFEALVSEVCDAFGCTPAEAMRQDFVLTLGIMTYRNAKRGLALAKQGKEGATRLIEDTAAAEALVRLGRAQGAYGTIEQAMAYINAKDSDGDGG